MNPYEIAYVGQGYELHEDLTWDIVHTARDRWGIPAWRVPLSSSGALAVWGVPYLPNGIPMHHPPIPKP